MRPETRTALLAAHTAARDIEHHISGVGFSYYEQERTVRAAVEREFEVIGEALNRVRRNDPDAFLLVREHEGVIDLRNVISHGYDIIDNRRIWDFVQDMLPELVARLEYALEQE